MAQPKKLVVLGGGMGSLSTLYWITSQPNWQERYDITLYQLGWRLGGKGASGRNTDYFNRIEEHGYHILFGFYHNTLKMMKECYKELGRSPNAPISDFYADSEQDERLYPHRYAIKRVNTHTFFQEIPPDNPEMHPINFTLPLNDSLGPNHDRHTFVDILRTIYDRMQSAYSAMFEDTRPSSHTKKGQPSWWSELESIAPGIVQLIKIQVDNYLGLGGHLNAVGDLLRYIPKNEKLLREDYWDLYQFIGRLIRLHLRELWEEVTHKDKVKTDRDTYELWVRQDFFGRIFAGIIEDDLMEKGLDSINDKNFIDWFIEKEIVLDKDHLTEQSMLVSAMYNFGFCFRDGDGESYNSKHSMPGQPDVEAGVLLRVLLRWMFDYEGAPYWFFQVGCGDALFAPLYEVLRRRGVKFKFFYEVKKLKVSDDRIEQIEICPQVELKVHEYEPLVLVKGVPCWPSEPDYKQLVNGDLLKSAVENNGLDFEMPGTLWPGLGDDYPMFLAKFLHRGMDFDEVLFGIAPGAFCVGGLCDELCQNSPGWEEMVKHLKVIPTEALQIRLSKSVHDLGWDYPRKLLAMEGTGDLNTFADMPQQLDWESWPPTKKEFNFEHPQSSFYFVSAMPKSATTGTNFEAEEYVRKVSIEFLNGKFIEMFPKAARKTGSIQITVPRTTIFTSIPFPTEITGVAWDVQNIRLLVWSNDGFVRAWVYNPSSGKIIVEWLLDHKLKPTDDEPVVLGAQWAPQANPAGQLVTWADNGMAYVWQIPTEQTGNGPQKIPPSAYLPHKGPIGGAAWCPVSPNIPERSNVLTWSEDRTACVWDIANKSTQNGAVRVVTLPHNGPVLGAAWGPDSCYVLTCCKDGAAHMWKVYDWMESEYVQPTAPLAKLPHSRSVLGCIWDPLRIVTWSEDNTACVWFLMSHQVVYKYTLSHNAPVLGVAWSPYPAQNLTSEITYKQIVTWSADKTVWIWDVPQYQDGVTMPALGPGFTLPYQALIKGAAWKPNIDQDSIPTLVTWDDGSVNVWMQPYWSPVSSLPVTGIPTNAQWSQNSDLLLYAENVQEFDWGLLTYDTFDTPQPVSQDDYIKTQYTRANLHPSDQYVLTVVNSSKYRLSADGTDFENLFIAGDWTKNGLNVGCMEAATLSGMIASRAMTGEPQWIEGEYDFDLIPMPGHRDSQPLQDTVISTLDAGADFYQQLAKAIAAGFQGFRDEVSVENLTSRSLFNALLNGGIKGGSQFIAQLQQAVSALQRDLGPLLPNGVQLGNLDYSYLAKLVSDEIRNQANRRSR